MVNREALRILDNYMKWNFVHIALFPPFIISVNLDGDVSGINDVEAARFRPITLCFVTFLCVSFGMSF